MVWLAGLAGCIAGCAIAAIARTFPLYAAFFVAGCIGRIFCIVDSVRFRTHRSLPTTLSVLARGALFVVLSLGISSLRDMFVDSVLQPTDSMRPTLIPGYVWGPIPLENITARPAFVYWSARDDQFHLDRIGLSL